MPGGIALSRERLDAALVDLAVASGAVFLPRTEGLVGPIEADARRVTLVQVDRAVTARARVVLVATGLGQVRFEENRLSRASAQRDPGSAPDAWSTLSPTSTIREQSS